MTVQEVIRLTKYEFLKNDLNLKRMVLGKATFQKLKDECKLIRKYSSNTKLPDNQIEYLGILVEEGDDEKI